MLPCRSISSGMRTDETFEGRTSRIKRSKNKQENASSFVGHEHDYVLLPLLLWVSFLSSCLWCSTTQTQVSKLSYTYVCVHNWKHSPRVLLVGCTLPELSSKTADCLKNKINSPDSLDRVQTTSSEFYKSLLRVGRRPTWNRSFNPTSVPSSTKRETNKKQNSWAVATVGRELGVRRSRALYSAKLIRLVLWNFII